MPCPFHSDRPDDADRDSADGAEPSSRRSFLKAAVAIGGTNALAACARREDERPVTTAGSADPKYPRGPEELSTLPDRQHAWAEYIRTNRQNQVVFPQHQVFVFLDYSLDGPPDAAARSRVERGFRTLERAFQRGLGDDSNSLVIDGLLFTVGYARSYFDRFDADLPERARVMRPGELLERLGEDPALADDYDAVLHLGSDVAEIVLAAEEALFGGVDRVNGVTVEGGLGAAFDRAERRAGLIGSGLPADRLDRDVSSKAPVPMGFKSAFADTLPGEDRVTVRDGPFAGATTQHVSLLVEHLDEWYDQDHTDRIEKMFGPSFDRSDVGEAGERLGNFSELSEESARRVPDAVEEHGRVGHAQKLARARDEGFDPVIMRRGDFFETGAEGTVLNFGAIQRSMEAFVRTRRAMTDLGFGDDPDSLSVADEENGLLDYIETRSRATFLVPPRSLRSLPSSRPDR